MGVSGAAWATFIAQGVSAVISFLLLTDKVYIKDHERAEFSFFSGAVLKEMSSYAAVSVIQQSVVSVGMLIVQSAVNPFGSDVLAGYTAASKIDSFAIMPFIACGNAVSTYTAQNLGAGKKRAYQRGLQGERAVMRRHSGDRICSDNASQTAIFGLFYGLVKLLSFRHRKQAWAT